MTDTTSPRRTAEIEPLVPTLPSTTDRSRPSRSDDRSARAPTGAREAPDPLVPDLR